MKEVEGLKKFLLVGLLILITLTGCTNYSVPIYENKDKISIVTTIFPPYDFAKGVAGDRADITMLLKAGTESHSYEPSPADIIAAQNCDIFIYNGGKSDVWVNTILDTIENPDLKVIKMLDCVENLTEETVEGMQGVHHHHNGEECHHIEYDEHIWTSPLNAIAITKKIADAIIEVDPENADEYIKNLTQYTNKLDDIHNSFLKIVNNSEEKTMIFGDRFPFRYFADCYGLDYWAAFPGCSAEAEPSAKTVVYLIEKTKEENIENIFYIEFSNMKIANTICEETGAKPLLFHSCHNVSSDEMEKGVTYIDLMTENIKNLREALN